MLGFERAFVATDEMDNGPLSARYSGCATFIMILLFGLSLVPLWPLFTPLQITVVAALGLVLARLLVIDLCYLLLPNVYVFPLILAAPFAAPLLGHITWVESLVGMAVATGIGTVLLVLLSLLKRPDDLGMGDIKFLLVMGAWLGTAALPLTFAISCLIGLGLSLLVARGAAFPLGPALIIGLWAALFYMPTLENLLIRLIGLIP